MRAQFTKTDRIVVLDIDGNTLAIFMGYACPTRDEIKRYYPTFQKVQIFGRNGKLKGILA